jgi:hypothetical protein
MTKKRQNFVKSLGAATMAAAALVPNNARPCACGCGVFDVATSSMLPDGPGGTVYVQYAFQNQNRNWSGYSPAPGENNADKAIQTSFVTTGLQYMFDRDWGMQLEVPYAYRHFTTTGGPDANTIETANWGSLGDIRLEGIYTGFSQDMSTGLTLGLKLPTGNFSHEDAYGDIDRDTQIGTGSTDVLLGGFHRSLLDKDGHWTGFIQGLADLPFLKQADYRPGFEFDAAAGVYYSGISCHGVRINPVAQIIGSLRTHDSGADSSMNPISSGYQRILVSPGVEFHVHPFMIYADAEIPVYQYFKGDQLAANALFKIVVSYSF